MPFIPTLSADRVLRLYKPGNTPTLLNNASVVPEPLLLAKMYACKMKLHCSIRLSLYGSLFQSERHSATTSSEITGILTDIPGDTSHVN